MLLLIRTDRQLESSETTANSQNQSLSLSSFGPHKRSYTRRQIHPPPFTKQNQAHTTAQPPLLSRLCSAASAPPPRLCRPISTPPGSPIPPTPPLFGYRPSSRTLLHSRTESRTAELLLSIARPPTTSSTETLTNMVRNLSYGPSIVTAETPTYTARTTPYTDRIGSLHVPVPTLYVPYNLPYGPYSLI